MSRDQISHGSSNPSASKDECILIRWHMEKVSNVFPEALVWYTRIVIIGGSIREGEKDSKCAQPVFIKVKDAHLIADYQENLRWLSVFQFSVQKSENFIY